VKVGKYALLSGSCPVANQTVIVKDGRRPMALMK
jgi:hypothetical protein